MKRKIEQFLMSLIEVIERHSENVRYMWPDKSYSTRFKVLNFLSCDALRIEVSVIENKLKHMESIIEICDRTYDNETAVEDHKRMVAAVKKYIGYLYANLNSLKKK